MKKLMLIPAILLVFGFLFVGCGDGDSKDDGKLTVTFTPNGGSGAPKAVKVDKGEKVKITDAPTFTRDGHEFAGWGESAGTPVAGPFFNFDTAIEANKVLYAVWEEVDGDAWMQRLLEEAEFDPGSGGNGGKVTSLATNGVINPAVGNTFMFSYADDSGTYLGHEMITALTPFESGATVTVLFEKYVDISGTSSKIVFDLSSGGQWWHGGVLFFYNENDPYEPYEAQWWSGGGLPTSGGKIEFAFTNFMSLGDGKGTADFTKLAGFSVKSTDTIVIANITVE